LLHAEKNKPAATKIDNWIFMFYRF